MKVPQRKFVIITDPHIADPAWQIPLAELIEDENDKTIIQFTNFNVLKDLINVCEKRMAYKSGYAQGLDEALSTLGVTFEEYLRRKSEDELEKSCES